MPLVGRTGSPGKMFILFFQKKDPEKRNLNWGGSNKSPKDRASRKIE